jgi:predicted TIM-barrel fold metal-dependent hydrolase
MDRYGIDTVVTAPHAFLGGYQDLANQITAQLSRDYPGRIWGYIVAHPFWTIREIQAEIAKHIDNENFVGFKLLPGYQGPLLSPGNEAIFAAAESRGMPVLSHTWAKNPPVAEFEKALRRYPHVPLLIGHCGGARETYQEFIALSKDFPNACLEICGSLYVDWWFEDIVAAAGADRLFFGTDLINVEPRYEIGRVGLADIGEADKKKIFAENFLKILKRKPPAAGT